MVCSEHNLKARICKLISQGFYTSPMIIDSFPSDLHNDVMTVMAKMWNEGLISRMLSMEDPVVFSTPADVSPPHDSRQIIKTRSYLEELWERYRNGPYRNGP